MECHSHETALLVLPESSTKMPWVTASFLREAGVTGDHKKGAIDCRSSSWHHWDPKTPNFSKLIERS